MLIQGGVLMVQQQFVIASPNGLSSRASANLVSEANRYKSDVFLNYQGESANMKSIMNVMALVIRQNEAFEVLCEGDDETNAIENISKLMKDINLI